MTDKIPPVAKFAVLLAAVVAVTGCSAARQQSAAPTTAQATKPAPRRQAPAKPRIVRPHNRAVPILMYHVVGTALLDGKLTTPQIKLMIRQGWEIDAHTINHVDLTTLSSSDLRHEVAGSRTWIRRRFHVPAAFFCYPSGRYDARVVAAVRAAGFFGATIEGFGPASPRDGLLTLPRIRVDGSDGVSGLAAKLAAYG